MKKQSRADDSHIISFFFIFFFFFFFSSSSSSSCSVSQLWHQPCNLSFPFFPHNLFYLTHLCFNQSKKRQKLERDGYKTTLLPFLFLPASFFPSDMVGSQSLQQRHNRAEKLPTSWDEKKYENKAKLSK